jgi:hypothetical protein
MQLEAEHAVVTAGVGKGLGCGPLALGVGVGDGLGSQFSIFICPGKYPKPE